MTAGDAVGRGVYRLPMENTSLITRYVSPSLWLAAFVSALYPLNQFQLELMAASVILLLLWSYDRLSRAVKNGLSMPRTAIVGVVAGLWALSFASIFWSEMPWVSTIAFFFMGALPLTFLTLAFSPYTHAEWKVTLIGAGGIFAILALWAIAQIAFFADYFRGRAVHPLRDPNSLAALFNIALLPALGWLGIAKERKRVVIAFALCVVLMGGMVATGSRGGFFMLVLGAVLIALFYRSAVVSHWRRWVVMGVLLAGFLAAPLLVTSESRTTFGRVSDTLDVNAPAVAGERLMLMKTSWNIVKDHWVGGTGVGTFHLYYPAYRSDEQRGITTHAHNDPLQMWAETGIAAPLLIYTLFVLAIIATRRRGAGLSGDDAARAPLMLSFITLGVLMAHSHFNLNLYNLSILMMAGLVMAYWFAQLDVPRRAMATPAGKGGQAVLAVIFAVPVIAYGCVIASEHYLSRAREAMMTGRIDEYGNAMLAADMLGFQRNPNVYLAAVHIPISLLHRNREALEPDEWVKEAAQINGNLDAALAGNPLLASAWYFKGMLAQIVPAQFHPEGLADAKTAYETALSLDPLNIGARQALLDMAVADDDFDAAADLVRPIIGVKFYNAAISELYSRALAVFTLVGDEDAKQAVIADIKEFRKRSEFTRTREEKSPFRLRSGGTFPQAVESSDK